MKVSEVPSRDRVETRDFQRKNLRGKSFKGRDLSGADFSEADLRGTNFTGANLRGANFTGAKCGLQKRWLVFLTFLSYQIVGQLGLSLFTIINLALILFRYNLRNQVHNFISLLVLVLFILILIFQGIRVFAFILAGSAITIISGILVLILGYTSSYVEADKLVEVLPSVIQEMGTATPLVGVILEGLFIFALVAIAVTTFTLWGTVTRTVAGNIAGILTFTVALVLFVFMGFVGIATVTAAGYVSWRAMRGDPRDAWIRSFAIAFAALGGTSFRGADLTDANFSSVKLKSTDMRKATLTGVRWYGADMLDRVRPGKTYLQNTQVRQWLLGKGSDKNFDGQKLQGVNFQGADLTDASFIDANLNEANLQDTDLSRAKLVQTQLDKTDFTDATITGAFIEDWGITSNTKLDGVRCQYVFMRLPTDDNPEPFRKPDNRSEVFEDGDFADFIKPIFDTLDLYHNQDVDPRAIAFSFKELAENNSDKELEIVAMERKGINKFLLRVKTKPGVDKSQLSAEYFETYNQFKALAEEESRKLIAEKDNRIQQLETMVKTALKRPGFYVKNYNHQGDNEMARDYKVEGDFIQGNKTDESNNLNNSGTINNSGAGAFSLGDIHGTVANTINQLQPSSNPEESGIKELLTQLQTAVNDPNLSEDDKQQVLEQVQILAEAGQNLQDETMKKKAERAVSFLEVIAKGVEPASKLAKASANVLPKIITFFV